jgi:hypothetical protein
MFGRAARLPLDLIIPDIDLDLKLTPEKYANNLKATLEKVLKIKQVNRDVRMEKNKIKRSIGRQRYGTG